MTLTSHGQGLITDEELVEENNSRNPDFSYDAYDTFDLDNMEEAECKSESREARHSSFSRSSFLARHLYMPPEISGRWYRGFMFGSKANEFPLPLQ